jgi:hypothetical protein
MGNQLHRQRRDKVHVRRLAVNVEKRLAERGQHLDQLCTLDLELFCSVQTRGAFTQVQSGAFLWYLLSPTAEQLDLLADTQGCNAEDCWSSKCFKSNKDGTMEAIIPSTNNTDNSQTDQVLLCYNDIELCVGDENVWNHLNRRDRSRVEMTMSSTMDMTKSNRGLVAGTYRVDFYHSDIPFDKKFYLNKILPPATKSVNFQVL